MLNNDTEITPGVSENGAADQEAADKVTAMVNGFPAKITLENKLEVAAASAAFAKLTESQKALIPDDVKSTLTAAETTIKEMEAEAAAEKSAAEASAAELVDVSQNGIVGNPYKSYGASVGAKRDGVYPVTFTADGLLAHKNARTGKFGYWVGFQVKAPEGVDSLKWAFRDDELGPVEPLAEINGGRGAVFYMDAENLKETSYRLQWVAGQEDFGKPLKFEAILGSFLRTPLKLGTVFPAYLFDPEPDGVAPKDMFTPGTYKVTGAEVEGKFNTYDIHIAADSLFTHDEDTFRNEYEAGFAVVAPDGADGFVYSFKANTPGVSSEFGEEKKNGLLPNIGHPGTMSADDSSEYKPAEGFSERIKATKDRLNGRESLTYRLRWMRKGHTISDIFYFNVDLEGVTVRQKSGVLYDDLVEKYRQEQGLTWEDESRDAALGELYGEAREYLDHLSRVPGGGRQLNPLYDRLVTEYVRYVRANAFDEFKVNYAKELLDLQLAGAAYNAN